MIGGSTIGAGLEPVGRDEVTPLVGETGAAFVLYLIKITPFVCLDQDVVPPSPKDGLWTRNLKHANLECIAFMLVHLGSIGRRITNKRRPITTQSMHINEVIATVLGTTGLPLMECYAKRTGRLQCRANRFVQWERLMSMLKTNLIHMSFSVRQCFLDTRSSSFRHWSNQAKPWWSPLSQWTSGMVHRTRSLLMETSTSALLGRISWRRALGMNLVLVEQPCCRMRLGLESKIMEWSTPHITFTSNQIPKSPRLMWGTNWIWNGNLFCAFLFESLCLVPHPSRVFVVRCFVATMWSKLTYLNVLPIQAPRRWSSCSRSHTSLRSMVISISKKTPFLLQ